MISRLRTHFRQQFVGYIALFVAMGGGTAYAIEQWTGANIVDGSLTGADIQGGEVRNGYTLDGTITGADVSDGSLTYNDIGLNTLNGARIRDESLTGADIDESSLGQVPNASKAGVRNPQRVYDSTTYSSDDIKSAVADCPTGKVAVGGGYDLRGGFIIPRGVSVKKSEPSNNSSWFVLAGEDVMTQLNWSLTAYALCVDG